MSRRVTAFRVAAFVLVLALVASVAVGVSPSRFANPRPVLATTFQDGDDLFPVAPPVLALTPPMGWNGFNRFYVTVGESTVKAAAQYLVLSGMKAAGYTYVNLDGGWNLKVRDVRHDLQPNLTKFPHGIAAVADYVHSLGLKFGIYTSAGTSNCAGTSAGSYGHYRQDAMLFASWGVDYLKLDWCHVPYHDYPHMTHAQVSEMLGIQMHEAIASTGRPIVFDVNDWADQQAWVWAKGLGSLWRTTPDIQDRYASLVWNFTHNVGRSAQAGPGAWNDPDMLEVGNGGMTATEYRSQFSLWAEMAAPLIAGNDLTKMSPSTLSTLTNPFVIAVDQDPLGVQGHPVQSSAGHWVLTKLLSDGNRAVVLFNQTDKPATISTTAAQVELAAAPPYMLNDLWTGVATQTTGAISATVPAHSVVMYRISAINTPPLRI